MDYKEEVQKLVEEIKAQGFEAICFWHPVYSVGGATYYYAELAKYLINFSGLNLYYMDYPNGYSLNLLSDVPKIEMLSYDEKNTTFPVKEKCVIIVNSTRVIQMPEMNPDNKILFWHYETIPCAWDAVLINKETKKYLNLAKKNNAMVFHDWSARNSLSKYKNSNFKNKDYLHVYTTPKEVFVKDSIVDKEEINIAFLSRLVPDKIQSLFYLIENFANYQINKKKKLHIIGDGRCKNEVLRFCKKYEDKIEFIFTGTIQRENLDEYLINNVDILFGVGTCVLEAAALKLPSVALIMSSKKLNEDEVYWAYNTKEYAMGILDIQKKDFKIKYSKIKDIIDSVYKVPQGKLSEGEKCYKYYLDYHSNYDNLVCKFLTFIKNSTLTYKKLKETIKYTPYSAVTIEKIGSKNITVFKKITFMNVVRYYLFNILILKKIIEGSTIRYRFLGLKLNHYSKKVPYKFPSAQFADGKKG